MQMLPMEIIHFHIIPYTYTYQPIHLLSDIKNYIETREIISTIYYNKYKDLLQYEKNADKNWLISDILLFIKLIKLKLKQNPSTIARIHIYCNKKGNVNSRLNYIWSILTVEERNIFIQVRTPKKPKLKPSQLLL